jgi:hypothetical protein
MTATYRRPRRSLGPGKVRIPTGTGTVRHASARAALNYQHVDPERERDIAQALSKKIEAERPDHLAREWHDGDDEAGESS